MTTVLIVNPGSELYGSDRMVLETTSALVEVGTRVVVVVAAEGPLVPLLRERGAEVRLCRTAVIRKSALRPAGLLRFVGDLLASVRPGWSTIRAVRPQVMLVNTSIAPLWLLLGRVARTPVVCHVHESEASVAKPIRFALALPLLLAQRLIVNSRFSLGVLTREIPRLERRSKVIYNAVPAPIDPPPPRTQLDGGCRLVFVGRLSPRKGPQIAVRALAELRRRGIPATLTLVGAVFAGYEWFENELHDLVTSEQLENQVTFVGFKPEVAEFRVAADVMLIPSTVDEPFGNTAVEAALAARPSVVSAVGGLPEAASGLASAILVEHDRPDAIADAVSRIAANWHEYRIKALADSTEIIERYSLQTYAEQINSVIGSLL